jgi:3-deoxy-7-phosphoheptulonate synthase
MNMRFYRKLPIPKEIKEQFPVSEEIAAIREKRLAEMRDIFSGKSNRFLLIIGPCSADREDAVMDYIHRLKDVQAEVRDKIMIVPRVYTNKPRTTGDGYKGLFSQPNPDAAPDLLSGVIAMRSLHMKAIKETGFCCADEMLYPENHRYLSDLIGYVAIGARSVENQQHRLTASGLNIPVGMKNPTSGDITVMMNSIKAAHHKHIFCYRGWEVETQGNPYAHAILRGYVDKLGRTHSNYHYEDLAQLFEFYKESGLENPAAIIDTNHANSGKKYLEQIRISKEILYSCRHSADVQKLVKGLMIESYLEDGAQSDTAVYGKSITDPCLGWDKTERMVLELAELI